MCLSGARQANGAKARASAADGFDSYDSTSFTKNEDPSIWKRISMP